MDDLIAFLRARLDEDEQTARAAAGDLYGVLGQVEYSDAAAEADERHILRHKPARVLAEVDAKRRILEAHERRPMPKGDSADCAQCWGAVWPCPTIRLLALPYASHPDYRDEWRP